MEWMFWLALLPLLGNDSFQVREKTFAKFRDNSDFAIGAILIGEKSPVTEIRLRCELLAREWFCRHADELAETWKPRGWEYWPSIDGSIDPDNYDDPGLLDDIFRWWTLAAQSDLRGSKSPHPRYSEATRMLIASMIAWRLPPKEIDALLIVLCRAERQYCRAYELAVPPRYRGKGK